MIKRYIRNQVRRHGAKAVIMWVIDTIVKVTPSKKDDAMFARVKDAMEAVEKKKKSAPKAKPKGKELEK